MPRRNCTRQGVRPATRPPARAPRDRNPITVGLTIIEEDEPWPDYVALMQRLIFGATPPPLRPVEWQVPA
jgi:hypothetical protein